MAAPPWMWGSHPDMSSGKWPAGVPCQHSSQVTSCGSFAASGVHAIYTDSPRTFP